MSHKADVRFFLAKKQWSQRKDLILGYYLKPYITKIAQLNRPILLVDGFAGPGKYGDGTIGSPLIIHQIARSYWKDNEVDITCLFVEKNKELFEQLISNTRDLSRVERLNQSFSDTANYIASKAESHVVFLYLDPFTVSGLEWPILEKLFSYIHRGKSIEVLLNLNIFSFLRRALAAMKISTSEVDEQQSDSDDPSESISVSDLDLIAGGEWWQPIANSDRTFEQKHDDLLLEFTRRMQNHFDEVCFYKVKEKDSHKIPKYVLVFGSRHPHALLLMNEAMIRAREQQATQENTSDALFEMRSHDLVPDINELPNIALNAIDGTLNREQVRLRVIRNHFCRYSEKQINRAIQQLHDDRRIYGLQKSSRLNDDTVLCRTEPT